MITGTLVATVGLPRSGKTTWTEAMREVRGWPVVSMDAYREALAEGKAHTAVENIIRCHVEIAVRANLTRREVCLLDACLLRRWERKQFLDNSYDVVFKVMDVGAETCVKRARRGGQFALAEHIWRLDRERDPIGADKARFQEWDDATA